MSPALPNPFAFEDQHELNLRRLRAVAGEVETELDRAGRAGRLAVAAALGVPIEEEPVDLPMFLAGPRRDQMEPDKPGWTAPIVRVIERYAALSH